MEKINFSKDFEFWVQRIVGTEIDENGDAHIKTEWIKEDRDISLGSMKKPNKDIIGYQWKLKPEAQQKQQSKFFRGMFGG